MRFLKVLSDSGAGVFLKSAVIVYILEDNLDICSVLDLSW